MAHGDRSILCFGGSFNPIHNGHLLCAQAVAEKQGYEQILLIPSASPPHRIREISMASAKDRLTMCQLAVAGVSQFDVSDIELRRSGPSFTIDTAEALRHAGLKEVHWLIGGDTLPRLPTWYRFEELLGAVHFVVMARPDWDITWEGFDRSLWPLRQNVVKAPLIDISATGIRARVKAGRDIRFHTPPSVAAYIDQQGLYQ